MRTAQATVRRMLLGLRASVGLSSLAECWEHVAHFERTLRKRARLDGSALIFGPYHGSTWGAYWLDPACVEQFVACSLEEWIDTPSVVIERVRNVIARASR